MGVASVPALPCLDADIAKNKRCASPVRLPSLTECADFNGGVRPG